MLKYIVFLESDMRHNIQASRASTTITSYVLSDIRSSTNGGSTNIDIKIKNVSEYFKLILKFQLEGFFSQFTTEFLLSWTRYQKAPESKERTIKINDEYLSDHTLTK